MMLKEVLKQFLKNKTLIIVILIGTLLWSVTMFRSGLVYSYGIGFWGANGHDGMWHLALSESLSRGSFGNPVFSGEILKNYHLGFDLLIAFLSNLTKITVSLLYFQILPPVLALFVGLLTYVFVKNWRDSRSEALWATIFVYFSGGFGFIITLFKDGVLSGESVFWSQQAMSTLVNPPFALSIIFVLLGLIFLQGKRLFLSILFFGLLIQTKAYAAILLLGGLFVSGVYEYYKLKKLNYLKVFFGSLVLNIVLFFSVKTDGVSVFNWQPFWFLETMMSYTDRLGWQKFYSAMTTYKMGHVWLKGIIAYSVALLVFILGNMGLRVFGFYFIFKEKIKSLNVLILSVLFGALMIPMLFVQSGTPWNTIQFFYYYLFIFSILAGMSFSIILEKVSMGIRYVLIVIVGAFFVISAWATLQHYLPKMPQAIIPSDEITALDFLRDQEDGVVFTYPFDSQKAKEATLKPPRPLYFYDSTSYVSAYSKKDVYLEDEVNLNIMGYDWKERRNKSLDFISNLNPILGKKFLTDNSIKYLYLVKDNSPLSGELLKLGESDLNLKKIFENKGYIIYRYGEDLGGN